ncbi:MAG: hypothetical protein EOO90_13210 [Pedobacter sp.]|nr:MAG: hypothetical protein EOO90_13210 [Pedobacter sp.]
MEVIKFNEVKKIWHKIAKHSSSDNFNFELDISKKMLEIFHVGPYYYYIFNCSTAQVEYVSDMVKPILKLHATEDFTIERLLSIIHPDDQPYFLDFEKKVTKFFNELAPEKVLNYKVSYDYRARRNDGKYIRILQQVVTIQSDEKGAVLRVFGVHTDISHLKKPLGSTLSFLGLNGEPSFHDVSIGIPVFRPENSPFTKREKQVLELILQGKTSGQIAEELFISKLTVDGHRKKILRKTNSTSSLEVASKILAR